MKNFRLKHMRKKVKKNNLDSTFEKNMINLDELQYIIIVALSSKKYKLYVFRKSRFSNNVV